MKNYSRGSVGAAQRNTTPNEDSWETHWGAFTEWFDLVERIENATFAPMDAKGTERRIKDFIRETRTAAYERGVRDALQAIKYKGKAYTDELDAETAAVIKNHTPEWNYKAGKNDMLLECEEAIAKLTP